MDNSSKDNKSNNVIAEIDVNVHLTNLPPRNWSQENIDQHLNCILCGSHLNFKHSVDHINQSVKEEAHCSSCNVRNHTGEHKLQ